ncbi:MAG: type II toxin-antitoxin system MqsA family antitoxin [Anaerolineales bacterium]|nr:type II toxin-antitoxin system MqsA family antitoxin [Anaerolineales bacterium]
MICIICRQTDLIDGFTSIPLERDEFRLLIRNIPAQVCPNCGEAIVDEVAAIRLLDKAESIFEQGVMEGTHEY